MKVEDYRSLFMNNEHKNNELKKWEKDLRELEKDLRSIKKRQNPYEYVDFSDQYVQTSNPTKERGINTDEMEMSYTFQPKKKPSKSYMRSSFVDTVTTVLGGIPAATETLTDMDFTSPMEQNYRPQNFGHLQFKTRPQSSQLIGNTYSYNIKNGVIEEEGDPLGLNSFSTKSKNEFKSTSSIKINDFNSPSAIRPTALQRHQKAFKTHYGHKMRHVAKYSTMGVQRAKTASR